MESRDKYLPLGTIVFIKNDIVMHMITGYLNKTKDGKVNDYISIPFPYGLMSEGIITFFNHEDIENIIYMGYENDDYKKLNEIMKNNVTIDKKD